MQKLFHGSLYHELHLFLTGLKSSPRRHKQNACKHLWLRMLHICECLKWPLCGCIKPQMLLQGIHESECGYLLKFFMHQHPQDFPVLAHLSFWLMQRINPGDPTQIMYMAGICQVQDWAGVSKSLPDFSWQNQYEIWGTMKTLINQGRYTDIQIVIHFDYLREAALWKIKFWKITE